MGGGGRALERRDAKVAQLSARSAGDLLHHHVRLLHIAVRDAVGVKVREARRDIACEVKKLA